MMAAWLNPALADLPPEFPIFPLPGALLLPHGRLPLNVFEPRYHGDDRGQPGARPHVRA